MTSMVLGDSRLESLKSNVNTPLVCILSQFFLKIELKGLDLV
jgi:hypothetical protein